VVNSYIQLCKIQIHSTPSVTKYELRQSVW